MSWVNIHAIEQTQLRRKHRVDGVGAQNLISTQAAALDAGGDPAETATVLRPLVDLARREFGAEHEVTARLAADLTRALYLAGASADDLLEAEALRRESLTGGAAVLDASHEEYVRREELVAAAREVGWEPFSCEEIRAVTLER